MDRTAIVPRHLGFNVLPCSPLFNRLLRYAHARPPRVAIRDDNDGVERTHAEFLSDVLLLRGVLRENLSSATLKDLDTGRDVYIAVLAPGSYQFAVAILAVLALGAAVVPLSMWAS